MGINAMRKHFVLLTCAVVFLLAGLDSARAQTANTGALEGTVFDQSGAPVPGAEATLSSDAGLTRSVISDDAGRYRFSLLPPGSYRLNVQLEGFQGVSLTGIEVRITETGTLNVTLKVAQGPSELVTVTAENALVQTDSSTRGNVIEEKTIRQLPLPTRNFQQLLTLSAGTSGSVANSSELGRGDAVINVNGQRTTSNAVVINGVDANSIGTGSTPNLAVPATDTLQEFKVQTSLYDASQGRNTGGNVAAVTKSGTNDFRGNVYYFLRDDSLNANNFFLNAAGVSRPQHSRKQFGGTIGGPIIPDKAWFFGSYQGTREDNAVSLLNSLSTVFVPGNLTDDRSPAALAQLSQSFGLQGFVHPTAAALLGARLPNGDFVVPSSPFPSASPAPVAVSTPSVSHFEEDQFNANVDLQLHQSNRLFGKFFLANNPTQQALFSFAGLQNALPLPGFGADLEIGQRLLSIGDNHIFSPNVLNDFRFGYSYIRVASTPEEPFTAAQFGISSPLQNSFPGLPTISVTNFFDIGSSPFADNDSNVPTYQYSDLLSWNAGRHSLKIGGEYKRNAVNLEFNAYTRGNIFNLGFLGNPFADFLAGLSSLSIFGSGVNERAIRSWDASWFVNDTWKVNDRLTLNLGLRYDYFGNFTERDGRLVAFDPTLATTVPFPTGGVAVTGGFVQSGNATSPLPGIPLVGNGLVESDRNNFAPRLGFAFQPWDGRFVIRGGYGIYYDRPNARFINNQVLSFPYYSLALVFATPITNPFVQLPGPDAFPLDVTNPANFPFGGPPAFFPAAIQGGVAPVPANGIYPDVNNFRTPYVQQYNLSVQWEFVRNWLVDLSYVGSLGRKLTQLRSLNQAIAPGAVFPLGPGGPLSPGLSDLAAQGFGVHVMQTSADSQYDSFQATLNKRFSRGLQFLMSYTLAHSLDDYSGSPTGVSDVSVIPGNQVRLDNFASSDFDRRHRLVLSGIYDLPDFYRGGSKVGNALINNWELSGILTLQTGTPFSVLTSASAFAQSRADFAPGATVADAELGGPVNQRLNRYFNTAAFRPATGIGNFGTTGRNILRGPGQRNLDFSVVKFFEFDETRRFEFRTEFFNIFNNVSFADPVNLVTSGAFGRIVRTSTGPRTIQFGFKFSF